MKARLPAGFGKQNINQLMQQAQKVQGYVHQQSASADYVWPTDARILQNFRKHLACLPTQDFISVPF